MGSAPKNPRQILEEAARVARGEKVAPGAPAPRSIWSILGKLRRGDRAGAAAEAMPPEGVAGTAPRDVPPPAAARAPAERLPGQPPSLPPRAGAAPEGLPADAILKPFAYVERDNDIARAAWRVGRETSIADALTPGMHNRGLGHAVNQRAVEDPGVGKDQFFELLYSGAKQNDLLREAMMDRLGKTGFEARLWWKMNVSYVMRSASRMGRDALLGLYNDQLGAAISLLDKRRADYIKEIKTLGLDTVKGLEANYSKLVAQGVEKGVDPFKKLKDLRPEIDEHIPGLIRSVRENLFSREEYMGRRTTFQKTWGLHLRFLHGHLYKNTVAGLGALGRGDFATARDKLTQAAVEDLYGGLRRALQGYAWNANRQENGIFQATFIKPAITTASLWAFWMGPFAGVQEIGHQTGLTKERGIEIPLSWVPFVPDHWSVNTHGWEMTKRFKQTFLDPSEEEKATQAIEQAREAITRHSPSALAAKGTLQVTGSKFRDTYGQLQNGDDSAVGAIRAELRKREALLRNGGLTEPTNKEIDRKDELLSLLRQAMPPLTASAEDRKEREAILKQKREAAAELYQSPAATTQEIEGVLTEKQQNNHHLSFNKKVDEARVAAKSGAPLLPFTQALRAELAKRGGYVTSTNETDRGVETRLLQAVERGEIDALKEAYGKPEVSNKTIERAIDRLSLGFQKSGMAPLPTAPSAPPRIFLKPAPAAPPNLAPLPGPPAAPKTGPVIPPKGLQERADGAQPDDPDKTKLGAKTQGALVPQPT